MISRTRKINLVSERFKPNWKLYRKTIPRYLRSIQIVSNTMVIPKIRVHPNTLSHYYLYLIKHYTPYLHPNSPSKSVHFDYRVSMKSPCKLCGTRIPPYTLAYTRDVSVQGHKFRTTTGKDRPKRKTV